ncbi:MAG TPA: hypothetical protein VFS43_42420 [Polyangiaceae bacterium]|nr:hypothetical protein [Polyangiaceae bacterium]
MAKTSKGGRAAAERLKNDLLAAKEWLNSAKNDGQVLTNTAPANRWEQLTFEQRLALADAIRQRRRLAAKLARAARPAPRPAGEPDSPPPEGGWEVVGGDERRPTLAVRYGQTSYVFERAAR